MSLCKACGHPINWIIEDDRWRCYNDGTKDDHFDLCSQLKFERIKRTGEFFEGKREQGYLTPFKPSGIQYTMQSSGIKRGKHKISKDCGRCVPPWDVCDRPCPNALK